MMEMKVCDIERNCFSAPCTFALPQRSGGITKPKSASMLSASGKHWKAVLAGYLTYAACNHKRL